MHKDSSLNSLYNLMGYPNPSTSLQEIQREKNTVQKKTSHAQNLICQFEAVFVPVWKPRSALLTCLSEFILIETWQVRRDTTVTLDGSGWVLFESRHVHWER